MRSISRIARWAAVAALAVGWGCATANPEATSSLSRMNSSLEARQYDQVVSDSQEFLAKTPQGPGSAGALYLRGRAYEDRPNPSEAQAKGNLQNARTAYIAALDHNPPPLLEAYIRASLANVAYFQDDYATASRQWLAALDGLDAPDLKAWSLYRAGVSYQRLGEFAKADQLFAQLQNSSSYANTVPAQRSAERKGARSFYVQLAAFSTNERAAAASQAARARGLILVVLRDSQGHYLLRTTPQPTYAAARQLQQRLIGEYPGAFVFP